MLRLFLAGFIATLLVSGLAKLGLADAPQQVQDSPPVVTRLAFRDRTVVITAAAEGRRYAVLGESGDTLQAELTEEQFSQQYPELYELMRPAVADDDGQLMMLAPIMQ
ncbi:MAG: hypothetical protein AAF609_15565 [Cyanobacteria bacterium P01_C01_bin.120]